MLFVKPDKKVASFLFIFSFLFYFNSFHISILINKNIYKSFQNYIY